MNLPNPTTHQVDERDQVDDQLDHAGEPGGTASLVDLLSDAPRFPAPWPAAEVPRREPWTAPEATVEMRYPDAEQLAESHVEPAPTSDQPTLAVPWRKLVTVGRFRVATQGLTDGAGAALLDLTPQAAIPPNQTWLLDRIVVRAGAAGQALVFAGGQNDQDLSGVLQLAAGVFAAQTDGNPVELRSGWRLLVQVVGGGVTLPCSATAYYRLCQWTPGADESV